MLATNKLAMLQFLQEKGILDSSLTESNLLEYDCGKPQNAEQGIVVSQYRAVDSKVASRAAMVFEIDMGRSARAFPKDFDACLKEYRERYTGYRRYRITDFSEFCPLSVLGARNSSKVAEVDRNH